MNSYKNSFYKLLQDDDFISLEKYIQTNGLSLWNILSKLKREEYHYSDFFSFLLNPMKNNEINDFILKSFLIRIINIHNEISENLFPIHPIEIKLADLSKTIVRREVNIPNFGRPDIVISNEEIGFSMIIEVKLFSNEGDSQTNNYQAGSNLIFDNDKFPLNKRLFIFLTPDGLEAENENFISISYQIWNDLINDTLKKVELSNSVKNILKDFLENNKDFTVDSEQHKLANDIYAKYGETIDLIYKIGNNLFENNDNSWNTIDIYYNIGEGEYRNWNDYISHSFISAGGGRKYSEPLKRLNVGQRIFAYFKGKGYLGVATVKEIAVPISEYVKENPLDGNNLVEPGLLHDFSDNELSEWIVKVDWEVIRERNNPVFFKGIFANQNIICKFTNRQNYTLQKLKYEFGINGA